MEIISEEQVREALSYPALIDSIKQAYGGKFSMPPRQVFLLDEDNKDNHDAFALLPSWNGDVIGVKSFTYLPDNKSPYNILYSKILLFDRKHGEPLALVDGTSCTYWRTGAVSALASQLLSREDSETMLMIGAGNLAPFIMKAHASVRPLKKILLCDIDLDKAKQTADDVQPELEGVQIEPVSDREKACGDADIIVSATGSPNVLVEGDWVGEGTHTDFIGNHHADKRECDTALVVKSKVYVDTYVNCLKEAGEVILPINEGAISKNDLLGELAELCAGKAPLRQNDTDITLFKAVGSALSDLVAAESAFKYQKTAV